jgi:hypothetical protein
MNTVEHNNGNDHITQPGVRMAGLQEILITLALVISRSLDVVRKSKNS